MRRISTRVPDLAALAFWALAVALMVIAGNVGPAESCDYDNKEAFVVAARRSGLVLFVAALAILAASGLLLGGAVASRGRWRPPRFVAAALSFLAAGYVAFIGLLERVAFDCLE